MCRASSRGEFSDQVTLKQETRSFRCKLSAIGAWRGDAPKGASPPLHHTYCFVMTAGEQLSRVFRRLVPVRFLAITYCEVSDDQIENQKLKLKTKN